MWRYLLVIVIGVSLTLPSAWAGETFVGWSDEFKDGSKVSSSNGVTFTEEGVQLPPRVLLRHGMVLPLGAPGSFDQDNAVPNAGLFEGGLYKMWYHGCVTGPSCSIGYATSTDGETWTKQGVVLGPTSPMEGVLTAYADVIRVGVTYRMFYSGYDGTYYRIFLAESTDGVAWTKRGVVLNPGPSGAPDDRYVARPAIVLQGSTYLMWYHGLSFGAPGQPQILLATSSDGLTWVRQGLVIPVGWQGTYDTVSAGLPTVRFVSEKYIMVYDGVDGPGVKRLLGAESTDGTTWQSTGIFLDVSPTETAVSHAALLPMADGSLYVYYSSCQYCWQGHLVTLGPPDRMGSVRSVPVTIPGGLEWGWFNQTVSIPSGTSVVVTVRDASSLAVLGSVDGAPFSLGLRSVDPVEHPTLVFEATLSADTSETPSLRAWEASWVVPSPADRQPTSPNAWPYLLAIAALAAVTVVLLALLVRERRRRTAPPPPG